MMERGIQKAAVLGSGVMGAAIAAHLANAGIQTHLLDIVPNKLTEQEQKKGLTLDHPAVRNRIATEAKGRLLRQNPRRYFEKERGFNCTGKSGRQSRVPDRSRLDRRSDC